MHESSSGLIASEICNSWKVLLFYKEKSEKIDFTHILAKVYTTPFAGRHFNTAIRMEYIAKTLCIINLFSFQHVNQSLFDHTGTHVCARMHTHMHTKMEYVQRGTEVKLNAG